MAFANLSVLALGSLLMGVPILLHLLMKKRPRHQVFPALRFLRQRQVENKRQMQLRNWLLLALRLAGVLLLATLMARPSVDSAGLGYWLRTLLLGVLAPLAIVAWLASRLHRKGRLMTGSLGAMSILLVAGLMYYGVQAWASVGDSGIGDPQAPVAAVLVFDTSPRMGLRHQNRTRLEEARGLARDLMKRLPAESEVAVVDATAAGVFSVDMGSATNLVDSLQVAGAEYPLQELVLRGIELVQSRPDKRQEVYVLTELSKAVWTEPAFRAVRQALTDHPEIAVFVLDVGVEQPRNVQLGELRLSATSLRKGETLRVETDVRSSNVSADASVSVSLESPDPSLPVLLDGKVILPDQVQRDRVGVSLAGASTIPVSFQLRMQTPGIYHGQVRLDVEDGLPIDNTRYFTVAVRPAWPALLVAGPGAALKYVEAVMSPWELRASGEVDFECQRVSSDGLLDAQLADFAVVSLLDPPAMTPEHWQRLADFVRNGGGLACFLGRNAASSGLESFNQLASAVLPGRLQTVRTGAEPVYFSLDDAAHPILQYFRGRESTIAWDASPVMRHWELGAMKPGSNVLTRFSNGQAALIESTLGSGRIITMTTPVSDVRNNASRPAWNYFPTSADGFPFFALMFGLFPYLADQSEPELNHGVNEVVTLALEEDTLQDETWLLFTPQLDWQNVRSNNGSLTIASTSWPGTYRLKDVQQAAWGFSVNVPSRSTELARLKPDQLEEVLGPDRYTVARGTAALNRGIGRSRVGRELFPFLALVVFGLLAMEHLMSNRFYGLAGSRPAPAPVPRAATPAV